MTSLPAVLARLSARGVFLHPPASLERRALALADLSDRGLFLPPDYQFLWEHCDGLEGLGVFLFGASGLPREEGHEPQPGIALQNSLREGQLPDGMLLVGKTVEHLWIVYDPSGREYQLRDGLTGDVFATFPGLLDILSAVARGEALF